MNTKTYLIITRYERSRIAVCRLHNHKVAVYNHGHAQAARLTEEQLQHTEQFRKIHMPSRNILRFLRVQDVGCAVRPLLETVGMTPTGKNSTVTTAFMCNE
ncbi:hypothetical protein M9H77_33734 [Catharanthus roseus]|uniref:Uncharacterized protein n=1 Tax=Catharanthus roseus TaxID=4058 RepID=A0ACB9ZKW7_CATRO|nr:hypothetical protein M9H77_33734 [Catharanthus roseus]